MAAHWFVTALREKSEYLKCNQLAGVGSEQMDTMCDGVTQELLKNIEQVFRIEQNHATECARMLADSPLGLAQRRALLVAMKTKTDLCSKDKISNNNKPMQVAYRIQNFFTASDWATMKDSSQSEAARHTVVCLRVLRCGLHVGT